MSSNRFGRHFSFTTFGESHGAGIGVVIDGCPAGILLNETLLHQDLQLRKPGSLWTSPRQVRDSFKILSGVYEGKTTHAPLTIWIENQDVDKKPYQSILNQYRPGHANFTYHKKYGHFDPGGGGRASARETAARVAAGSIAKMFLNHFEIELFAYLEKLGPLIVSTRKNCYEKEAFLARNRSPIFCLDPEKEPAALAFLDSLKQAGDSIGGIVRLITSRLPIGLGDPIYDKLEAWLGFAMLSIPGSKGVDFGLGFEFHEKQGSEVNDPFICESEAIRTETNYSGGLLGGISSGSPIDLSVCFKPTSSIKIAQKSVDFNGQPVHFQHDKSSRHDPCIAIRAVIVVEAMAALTLADAVLANRLVSI